MITDNKKNRQSKIKNIIFSCLGFIAFGLGTVGIVLPVLPTTPLYIATLFFFTKGSDKFKNWFLTTTLYKRYLHSFIKTKAMTTSAKFKVIFTITLLFLIAFYFINITYARITLIILWLIHILFFVFKVKSLSVNEIAKKLKMIEQEEIRY